MDKIHLSNQNDKRAFCAFLNKRKTDLGLDTDKILVDWVNPATGEVYTEKTFQRYFDNEGKDLPKTIKSETWTSLKDILKFSDNDWESFKQTYLADNPKLLADEIFSDEAFLNDIKKAIKTDLSLSKLFYEKIFPLLQLSNKITDLAIENFVAQVTEQCREGNFISLVQHSQSALRESWLEVDKNKNYEVRQMFKAAEGFVVKLALFTVNASWLAANPSQARKDIILPNIHLETLELALSRYSRTSPSNPRSKALAKGVKLYGKTYLVETGIKPNGAVLHILKSIAAELVPFYKSNIDAQDIEKVKTELGNLINKQLTLLKDHNDIYFRQNRFMLIPADEGSALNDPEVRNEIKKYANELEWITFKTTTKERVFIIDDTDLMLTLHNFFSTFDEFYNVWTDSRN